MPTEVTAQVSQSIVRSPGSPRTRQSKDAGPSGGTAVRQDLPAKLQTLPPAKDGNTAPRQQVTQVVDDLNSLVQNMKRDLQFSVDAESGEIIIKVVDSESRRIIRTIPPSEIDEISQRLKQTSGSLLFSTIV